MQFTLKALRLNRGAILISHEHREKAQRMQILKIQQRQRKMSPAMENPLTSTFVFLLPPPIFHVAVKSRLTTLYDSFIYLFILRASSRQAGMKIEKY